MIDFQQPDKLFNSIQSIKLKILVELIYLSMLYQSKLKNKKTSIINDKRLFNHVLKVD